MNNASQVKILIVEDEPMILGLAHEEFEDAGYSVVAATDAHAALSALEADPEIDLLFTDISMPGTINGWALAKLARTMRPKLPVIYATGYSVEDPQLVPDALLFMKPYRLTNVIDAVRRFMKAPEGPVSSA
jgi:CheY-like chemotaxis protein